MRCSRDPEVETNLTCGRCGTPICPKCLVQTPVGARCLKCADLKRLPTYVINPQQYIKAVGVGLVLAIVLGILWGLLQDFIPFLDLLTAICIGYAIGELISLSVNRKRGAGLPFIGGLCVALCYIVSHIDLSAGRLIFYYYFSFWDLLALAFGMFIAVSRLR